MLLVRVCYYCLSLINVKTGKPIRPYFSCWTSHDPSLDFSNSRKKLIKYNQLKLKQKVGTKRPDSPVYILCLSVLSVCINVKPIGPNFLWDPRVFEMVEFPKICLSQNEMFENFQNPGIFFYKIRDFFYCFTMYTKRTCSQLKQKMGLVYKYFIVIITRTYSMRKEDGPSI